MCDAIAMQPEMVLASESFLFLVYVITILSFLHLCKTASPTSHIPQTAYLTSHIPQTGGEANDKRQGSFHQGANRGGAYNGY